VLLGTTEHNKTTNKTEKKKREERNRFKMPGDEDGQNIRNAGSLSVKIPLFRGNTKKDSVTPDAWCDTVDRMQALMAWTEKQAADAAIDAMRDEANIWRENLTNGDATEVAAVAEWRLIKPKFLIRFASIQTAVQKVGVILGLKQKNEETTTAFFDRVDNAMKKVTKTDLAATNEKTGFIACRGVFSKLLFLAFLRPEVRMWVEANGIKDDTTMADIRQRAIDADHALKSKSASTGGQAAAIASVSVDDEPDVANIKEEISALNRQLSAMGGGRGGRGAGRGGRGAGRGGAAGSRIPKTPAEIAARKRWVHCRKCKQWGVHYAAECKMSDGDIGKMSPQSESDQPTGNTYDSQYPN
jgi:hypothetical protein